MEKELVALRRACGPAYVDAMLAKSFTPEDVERYYASTTHVDYKALELFVGGGGMHTVLSAPFPVGAQGRGTRQTTLVYGECCKIGARRVLELGCGKGYCALALAGLDSSLRVEGVDMVPEHVKVATRKGKGFRNVSFSHAHVVTMDVPDNLQGAYDVVFGVESLCHMDDDDTVAACVRNVRKLLRPAGRFVVVDGFRSRVFSEASPTARRCMELAEGGFRIRRMPSKQTWIDACAAQGLTLVQEKELTHEAVPFWTDARRIASFLVRVPFLLKVLLRFERTRESVANIVAALFVGYALTHKTAEYGMLVFSKDI
jgi:SAM-dependent methyltransferase